MKRPILAVRPNRHLKYKFVLDLRAFGNGRRFFKTRAEAEAERLRQSTTLQIHGREAMALPPHEVSDLIKARKAMAGYGKTVADAVAFFIDHQERVRRVKTTVAELAAELLAAKRKDGRSEIYLKDLRNRLAIFSRDFGSRPIAGITVEELDNWLRDLPLSPKSRTNFRAIIGVLFGDAARRRMIDHNPVLHTGKPKLPDNPPEIFTVDELRRLLEAASRVAPDVLPMLAIGAFAGFRDAEIKRLEWKEVDLTRGHIELPAAKAKGARRRIVPMQPNLKQWLLPYSGMTGRVVPKNPQERLGRARKAAGLARWPNNGLRHSFASYQLAAIQDAPRVSAELGHTSPTMLYNTYREVVRPEEAERYWKVAPAETANVVAFESGT